jgi:hypothetical protein
MQTFKLDEDRLVEILNQLMDQVRAIQETPQDLNKSAALLTISDLAVFLDEGKQA